MCGILRMSNTLEKAFVGKACAKVILLGEHFVLSGSSAIAIPVHDLWTKVRLRTGGSEKFEVDSENNFPMSRGFGSSASFAVALVRALKEFEFSQTGKKLSQSEIWNGVFEIEKIFHGTPSGVDPAVILAEQPIFFSMEKPVKKLKIQPIDFVIVDSGPREKCAEVLSRFSERRKSKEWMDYTKRASWIVNIGRIFLKNGDFYLLAECMNEAQAILQNLELSTSRIDKLITKGRKLGALAGKVSGAGCGGAVVFVCEPGQGTKIAKKMRAQGMEVLAVEQVQ